MKLNQTQKLTQTLILTPQMRQSLYILQLPVMDLKNYLENQLEENPVLKADNDFESLFKEPIDKFMDYGRDWTDSHLGFSPEEARKKVEYRQGLITSAVTLEENLYRQVRAMRLTPEGYKIAESIIANLDENGFLSLSIDELRLSLNKNFSGGEKLTRIDIEEVLSLIHKFDPPGIAAKNLRESLLIQLEIKNRKKSLAYTIVKKYLPDLAMNRVKMIARKLKVAVEEVHKAKEEISHLEPKPARAFDNSPVQERFSQVPDVIVENVNGRYEVIVNTKWLPKLRINPYYLKLFHSEGASPEIKSYIQEKAKATQAIIRALSQREDTIRKIAETIVSIQKSFFEHNDRSLLKPLRYREVAKIVGRNDSTVSRVVNSKYMLTPHGIFRMDYFFANHVNNTSGERISQELVKCQILNIIEEEPATSPLRDSEIKDILERQGIDIARRTVAKYRESLSIPTYSQRKKKHLSLKVSSCKSKNLPYGSDSKKSEYLALTR